MRPKRLAVAAAVALLLVTAGPAMAETDVVLDNESSGSEVHTGDSTFTNTDNTSVSSGTQAEVRQEDAFVNEAASPAAASTEPFSSVAEAASAVGPDVQRAAGRGEAQAARADARQDVLFVGFPISTSIAP